MKDSVVAEGYTFNNRIRLLFGICKKFKPIENTQLIPFILVTDEVLLNFGKEVTYNTFDQNRILLSFGIQKGNTQYQVGYMNRFVHTGVSQFTENHMLCFMVTQKLSLLKNKNNESLK